MAEGMGPTACEQAQGEGFLRIRSSPAVRAVLQEVLDVTTSAVAGVAAAAAANRAASSCSLGERKACGDVCRACPLCGAPWVAGAPERSSIGQSALPEDSDLRACTEMERSTPSSGSSSSSSSSTTTTTSSTATTSSGSEASGGPRGQSQTACCLEAARWQDALRHCAHGADGDDIPYGLVRYACRVARHARLRKTRSPESNSRSTTGPGSGAGSAPDDDAAAAPEPGRPAGWQQADDDDGPWLHKLLRSSEILLPSPPQRKKSPELLAMLAKLQEEAERKQYGELVADVTVAERRQAERQYLSSFRDQMAFGLNVITIMATGYLVGHAAMAAYDRENKHLHPFGGIIGLVIGMLVEVLLFIIRSEQWEEAEARRRAGKPSKNLDDDRCDDDVFGEGFSFRQPTTKNVIKGSSKNNSSRGARRRRVQN